MLTRLDDRQIAGPRDEIRGFLVIRNEGDRLPYLLSYYRSLGVGRFFVADDRSTDGTRQYLLSQEDVHVFEPSNTFKDSKNGVQWQNWLLDNYGAGHWTLVFDADEIFVYPKCEAVPLSDLCAFLDDEGALGIFTFMLDMYPEGDLAGGVCVPGRPFTEICPCFDKDYRFRKIRTSRNPGLEHPDIRVAGGPRTRLFYPGQARIDVLSRSVVTLMVKLAERLTFWRGDKPHYAPALIKMPLVRWQAGCQRLSNHIVRDPSRRPLSQISGAVLHFKFFADFQTRVVTEARGHGYAVGSQEYARYVQGFRKNPNLNFMYSGTRFYGTSECLVEEGLIKSSARYEDYAASLA